jgi:hypothetical protein
MSGNSPTLENQICWKIHTNRKMYKRDGASIKFSCVV